MFSRESLSEKYSTSARCRPLGKQVLDSIFYQREHTKPLFNGNYLLTIHNLYVYHSFIELFKVLKFRQPYSLFSSFNLPKSLTRSTRFGSTHITIPNTISATSNTFTYQAAKIWNIYRNKLNIFDFEIGVNFVKANLTSMILSIQSKGNTYECNTENSCNYWILVNDSIIIPRNSMLNHIKTLYICLNVCKGALHWKQSAAVARFQVQEGGQMYIV